MIVQLSGYFPALIIGEASVAAGYGLQRLAEPYLEKYPNQREMGRTIVNLSGTVAAACLIGTFALVPLHVAIAVGLIAQGVFRALSVLSTVNNTLVTKKDLMNFLTNLKKIPSLRNQFIRMQLEPDKLETFDEDSGSDSDPDLVAE